MNPFHLAMPVVDLESTRSFYGGLMGCREGRSAATWVDYDFFGHQLSFHVLPNSGVTGRNSVDGDAVPIPHFGVILPWEEWHRLRDQLIAGQVTFDIAPTIRFQGEVGEQATMFFRDPSGNALEFKSFKDPGRLFQS